MYTELLDIAYMDKGENEKTALECDSDSVQSSMGTPETIKLQSGQDPSVVVFLVNPHLPVNALHGHTLCF